MADVARIPRRRGGLCGLLLVVLGAWAALGPLIGPYFSFAYTPDTTWYYSDGRLYLSIVPGAAAALAGLFILATRSRGVGTFFGLLAAAAGAWLIVGDGVVTGVTQLSALSPGDPVRHSAGGLSTTTWQFLETIGLFTGVGILILFFAALSIGRFSMISARDAAATEDADYDTYSPESALPPPAGGSQYPAGGSQYPSGGTGQFASPSSQFPTSGGQFPASSSMPGSARPFPGDEPTETQARFPASTGQFPSSPSGTFPESRQS